MFKEFGEIIKLRRLADDEGQQKGMSDKSQLISSLWRVQKRGKLGLIYRHVRVKRNVTEQWQIWIVR